jgi:valyl-tRNA synthetase
MQISEDTFVGARNFANKIWNVSRFVLTYLGQNIGKDGFKPLDPEKDRAGLELCDKWILLKLQTAIAEVTAAVEGYNLAAASRALYQFIWNDFCDWYVELAKIRLLDASNPEKTQTALKVSEHVLSSILRLAHPIMPFITEEIWKIICEYKAQKHSSLLLTSYPTPEPIKFEDGEETLILHQISNIQELIGKVRNLRSEMNISPAEKISIFIKTGSPSIIQDFEKNRSYITHLCRASELTIGKDVQKPKQAASAVMLGDTEIFVPLAGLIDFEKERLRLEKDLLGAKTEIENLSKRLSFPDFRTHAPAEEVQRTEQRKTEAEQRFKRLEEYLASIR